MGYFYDDDLYYPEHWTDDEIDANPEDYYDLKALVDEEDAYLDYEAGLEVDEYDCS